MGVEGGISIAERGEKANSSGSTGSPVLLDWAFILGLSSLFLVPVTAQPSVLVPITAICALYVLALVEPWRKSPNDDKAPPLKRRVAVVGAGPSGIAAVKEFVAAGQDVTCFEAADSVGGLFARCYDRAVLTSSAAITAFSDFPPDPVEHRHFTKDEYKTYLEKYVDNFAIRPLIHLRTRVERANYDPAQGVWCLQVSQDNGASEEVGPFDTLVVCSGLNQVPNLPDVDSTAFTGQVLHSKDYINAKSFAGKRVVVVGLGETSADVVAEIAEVAASVTLSLRRGAYVIPRINRLTGFPNDYDSNRLRYSLPKWAHNLAVSIRDRALAHWGNAEPKDRYRLELLRKPGTPAPFLQVTFAANAVVTSVAVLGFTRGASFGAHMQQLRSKNLTLMAMVQRRLLDTTPACHPFRHGADTQLTLPVAVVAEMLPSDRILPLDWHTAGILKQAPGEEGAIRAVLGDETFTRLKQEDAATVNLIAKISKADTMSKTRTAMQAVAFSNLRA